MRYLCVELANVLLVLYRLSMDRVFIEYESSRTPEQGQVAAKRAARTEYVHEVSAMSALRRFLKLAMVTSSV